VLIAHPTDVWLLGIAAFALAITGSAVGRRDYLSARVRRFALPFALAALLALSFPVWLPPRTADRQMDTSPEAQRLYEQLGYGIAVLPPDAPLPTTLPDALAAMPGANEKIAPSVTSGSVGVLAHLTHGDVFQIMLTDPESLQILTSYFPGWSATFRDRRVRVMPHPEGGLMINLPSAGQGELMVWLDSTPPRFTGWVITFVTLGLLLLITFWRYGQSGETYVEVDYLTPGEARLSGALLVGMIGALALFATGAVSAPSGYALAASTAVNAQTNTGLGLLAYDAHQEGGEVALTLYWRAARFLPENYSVRVTITSSDADERPYTAARRSPGGYPTSRWLTNLYVTDPYRFPLPPAGASARVEVVSPDGESNLIFFASDGTEVGTEVILPLDP
jgi:hypothetical protein